MADVQDWLKLEGLEYRGEIETKRKALDERIVQIRAANAAKGLLLSGATVRMTANAHDEYRRDLIMTRISIRRKLSTDVPELLADIELDTLQEQLERTIQVGVQADRDEFERQSAAAGERLPKRSQHEIDAETGDQLALIRREILKLKLQRQLGMNQQAKGSIVVSISNSRVNGLNLGSIVGDMNATLTTLEQQGSADLASALKALTETLAADTSLGERRRELLENLSIIGEQGRLPTGERKTGIVKAAYRYVGDGVAISANAATIWSIWGPQIAAFFGFS